MSTAHQCRALEMLETGEGADCVIEVVQEGQEQSDDNQQNKPKEFNVHKYVLTVHSDVFRAMFSHKSTKEFRDSRIVISDATAAIVRQMLVYIYTGTLQSDQYDVDKDAVPLLKIAHKYQIKSLVDFNEQKLIDSLSLENVFNRLELADVYEISLLKSSCGRLIRRNLKTVKKNAKWIELKSKSPELAFAILEDFDDECRTRNEYSHCNCDHSRRRNREFPFHRTDMFVDQTPNREDRTYAQIMQEQMLSAEQERIG